MTAVEIARARLAHATATAKRATPRKRVAKTPRHGGLGHAIGIRYERAQTEEIPRVAVGVKQENCADGLEFHLIRKSAGDS